MPCERLAVTRLCFDKSQGYVILTVISALDEVCIFVFAMTKHIEFCLVLSRFLCSKIGGLFLFEFSCNQRAILTRYSSDSQAACYIFFKNSEMFFRIYSGFSGGFSGLVELLDLKIKLHLPNAVSMHKQGRWIDVSFMMDMSDAVTFVVWIDSG